MISAVILTLNEEVNIAECIRSLPWQQDVWLLDSGSTDRTVEIARELGAKVETRQFTNFADQRNAALALPTGEWIVMLDADERLTPKLCSEIEDVLRSASDGLTMLRVRRKDMFMGRWLRRSSGYPSWFPRVMRRGRVRVEREINEVYASDGETGELTEHLIHYPFNKGMDWWFERHGRYSAAEARLLLTAEAPTINSWRGLVSRDPLARRAALKQIAYSLPGRPFLAFIYLFVARLGFLDGAAGYHFASMRMAYEIMIDAKAAHCRFEKLSAKRKAE